MLRMEIGFTAKIVQLEKIQEGNCICSFGLRVAAISFRVIL